MAQRNTEKWRAIVATMRILIQEADALIKSEDKPASTFRPIAAPAPDEPEMYVTRAYEIPLDTFLPR